MKLEIEGIVLKQTPYKEKDAMISVLTKDGIVSFLAHNVLAVTSKNKSACLPYTFSLFNLNSRNDKLTLSQAKIIKSYAHLYSSFEYLASINLINECINKFIDEDNIYIFSYLKKYLELIEEGYSEVTLTLIMLAQIIKFSGYDLEYNQCVICGDKKNIVDVSYADGGFICAKCAKRNHRSSNYLKTFRYVFMIDSENMNYHLIDQNIGECLIYDFCSHLIKSFGFNELKSLEIYKASKSK